MNNLIKSALFSLLLVFATQVYAGSGKTLWGSNDDKSNKSNIFSNENTFSSKSNKGGFNKFSSKDNNRGGHKNKKGSKGGKKGCNPAVPVDGGLGLLLVGAAAIGVRNLRNKNGSNS